MRPYVVRMFQAWIPDAQLFQNLARMQNFSIREIRPPNGLGKHSREARLHRLLSLQVAKLKEASLLYIVWRDGMLGEQVYEPNPEGRPKEKQQHGR